MGFKVTVGGAKGITVQVSQVVPFAQVQLSATAVQPAADDPGGVMVAAAASFLVRIYLRCLKPCDPSGPKGCLITLLGCLLSSGWEILVGLSRMGFSCSSSGLALPRIRFRASAYSASRCARDLTGRAGLLVELGLLTTPLLVGLLRMRI